MNSKKFSAMKITSIYLLILFVFCVLYFRPIPLFADTDTNTIPTPNIPTSTEMLEFDIKGGPSFLIEAIIDWAFLLAGVLAFTMIVFAGFEYTTSGGNTNKQKEAQEIIINAIVGIILLFSFWIILNTINPDILKKSSKPSSTSETPAEVTPEEVTPEEVTPEDTSKNLIDITKLNPEAGVILINNALEQTAKTQNKTGAIFLNSNLAYKLQSISKNETNWKWVVTDACIDSDLPCLTTENTRPVGDCHYYGTCVDIDSSTGDNKTLITIFNAAGLNVLAEGGEDGWLHIALPGASGWGSYQNSCPNEKNCCIDVGCWYGATSN